MRFTFPNNHHKFAEIWNIHDKKLSSASECWLRLYFKVENINGQFQEGEKTWSVLNISINMKISL